MKRRNFIKTMGMATGTMPQTIGSNPLGGQKIESDRMRKPTSAQMRMKRISELQDPIAVAMWDYSWLQRHHRHGEFEDWDRVLDELVERQYDAIRIDVFPHLIAGDSNGRIQEEFYFPVQDWKPVLWGNQYSVSIRPRESVLQFLPKCRERGVRVGMSTWFIGPGVENITGLDGFVRVWDETLTFLDQNGLLDNCLCVDLLNEYPLYHGFKWLLNELNAYQGSSLHTAHPYERQTYSPMFRRNAYAPLAYNENQKQFYRSFMNQAIERLSERWPNLDFFTSQAFNYGVPWEDMDLSRYSALDIHFWFGMNAMLTSNTGYLTNLAPFASNDQQFADVQKNLQKNWDSYHDQLVHWITNEIQKVASKGAQEGVPYGSTEGWGLINWMDHPSLNWEIIKEAGEICAALGYENGYRFNCTSNFSHPQFPQLWKDVDWHRHVTNLIRGGDSYARNSENLH